MNNITLEKLQETLIDLEKARAKEAQERQLAEGVLGGLNIVTKEHEGDVCFKQLFLHLKNLVSFDQAFLFVGDQNNIESVEQFKCIYSEDESFKNKNIPISEFLRSKIKIDRSVNIFDTSQIEDFHEFTSFGGKKNVGSAIFRRLKTKTGLYLFLIYKNQRSSFSRLDKNMIDKMCSVILQAIIKDEYLFHLLHSNKMVSLGEMAGGVAHEINTPLSTLALCLEMIEMELSSPKADITKVSGYVNRGMTTVKRIASIVKGLVSICRDNKSQELNFFKIEDVVTDITSVCLDKFKFQAIPLEIQIGKELNSMEIKVERTQLSQILLNLVNNAYDACLENNVKWVKLKIDLIANSILNILVMDSGNGISVEKAGKIFEPFFTTKEVGKGTGLGLYLCHNIVKSMEGKIYVDQSQKNTCFHIEIPVEVREIQK